MSSQSQTPTGNLQRSVSTDSNQSPTKKTLSSKITLLESQTEETLDSSNDKDRKKYCIVGIYIKPRIFKKPIAIARRR